MTYILPITEVRKNIFALMEKVARTGEVIEVEKEGKRIVKIVPIAHDPAAKADYVLTHVLPKLAGAWRHVSPAELAAHRTWVRGKAEKRYWKRRTFS
ncbi:type II toxin-antitoxin system prevent-host-death family antitoxin [Candidatus Gottesmanbacteria bacterium]|nr:type II toxin-antitoxin system prevent-host-death family antitoxin [Candidatus Gottesmanbacteria bacterium]